MRTNKIKVVEVDGTQVMAHEGKIAALTSHYKNLLGQDGASTFGFDLRSLYIGRRSASSQLTADFTEAKAL